METDTKYSKAGAFFVLFGALAIAGHTQAAQVNADYINLQGGAINTNQSISGSAGRFKFDRQALSGGTEFAGTLVSNGGSINLGGNDDLFYGFCLEPNEGLIDPHVYDVENLQSAPDGGVSGAMGASRADDMRILFGNVYPDFSVDLSGDLTKAIALQIAVWEIANESDATYSVSGGAFSIDSGSQSGAQTLAQTWLDKIATNSMVDWNNSLKASGLLALIDTSAGKGQDYVVQAVPIPAAAWLFGSALLGFVGIARRKQAW